MVAASELSIDTGASAIEMAQTIMGDGVSVVSASYSGSSYSSGVYSGGDTTSPFLTPADSGVILSTGRASDITNSWGSSNRSNSTSTNTGGANNNSDFNALAGTNTYDAAYIDIDFVPTTGVLSIQFVFSSDEFPEYSGSIYNDIVGVWVNGSPVEIAVGNGDVAINNLTQSSNASLIHDNTDDDYNTEMDGFSATLTLTLHVTPGEVNSIRIGIADVSDSSYDSNLLIAAGSIQGVVLAGDDDVTVVPGGSTTIDVLDNDTGPASSTLTITHINGVAVSAGDTITLSTGQQITLNADGTFTVVADNDEEDVIFSYTVASGSGSSQVTDTAFVTIHSVPCFVAGTLIETWDGEVPVETLTPGTRVLTHDNGYQPLRWIGRRVVPARENFAPIRFAAGALGPHDEILLSPQHRVLIHDALAELLFEETEVLVAAKDLVNGHTVTVQEGGEVEYVHILFDSHQVVYTGGLATESFLPGPQTTASFEQEIVNEICTLFPELDPETGKGYSPAVRRVLKGYEARLLMRTAA